MSGKFGVIGAGLIGGSIAKSLASEVIVWDADPKTIEAAKAHGIEVASSTDELSNIVDLLVIAVPFDGFTDVFAQVQAAASRREKPLLVTNVLSVMKHVEVTEPNIGFVAGHPMAGTEHSGFEAARAGLFAGATWVLAKASEPLEDLVTRLGATAVVLSETDHNEAVARISHLPHVLAAAQLLAIADGDQSFALAASSFKDSTRVAGTKPELTAGMVGNNREEVLRSIEALKGVLEEFTDVLAAGNDESLTNLFERAKSLRDKNL